MGDAYTLYYFPFSLYSLMSRMGFELAATIDPENAPRYEVKLVNLDEDEEISEKFLTEVNSRGMVPVLKSPSSPSPIADSRDISRWLCEQQPQLVPSEHRDTIERLMDLVYGFHAQALCIPESRRTHGVKNLAAAQLERSDISERYRRALEIKSVFHDQFHGRTLEAEPVQATEAACARFRDALDDVLGQDRPEGGPWIFGAKPTIIDAHAVPMLARLVDVDRREFVPERLENYLRGAMATGEWQRVTHGRKTQPERSYGPARDLNPL